MEQRRIEPASYASGSRATPGVGHQPNNDDHNSQQNPRQRALAAIEQATTKMGKPRQRMKWTTEVNKSVMRCYFYVTTLETEMTMYRARMYEMFKQENPDIEVSEQRIADQRRTIVTRKFLPNNIIGLVP